MECHQGRLRDVVATEWNRVENLCSIYAGRRMQGGYNRRREEGFAFRVWLFESLDNVFGIPVDDIFVLILGNFLSTK